MCFLNTEKGTAFSRPLESQRCLEEDAVTFTCEVNKEGVQINWMKDGTVLVPCEGIRLESEGTLHKLVIERADLLKAGHYTATITRGVETTAELVVIGIFHFKYPFPNIVLVLSFEFNFFKVLNSFIIL